MAVRGPLYVIRRACYRLGDSGRRDPAKFEITLQMRMDIPGTPAVSTPLTKLAAYLPIGHRTKDLLAVGIPRQQSSRAAPIGWDRPLSALANPEPAYLRTARSDFMFLATF
jgi:hypothetical protein